MTFLFYIFLFVPLFYTFLVIPLFLKLFFYNSPCCFYLRRKVVWNLIEQNYIINISSFCYIRQIWVEGFSQTLFIGLHNTPKTLCTCLQKYVFLWLQERNFCFSGQWSSLPTPDSDHRGIWTGCFQVFTLSFIFTITNPCSFLKLILQLQWQQESTVKK